MRASLRSCAVAVSVMVLAGCGGTEAKHSQSSAPTPTSGGESAAEALLGRVAVALSRVHSFQMRGFMRGLDGSTSRIKAVFELPGRVQLEMAKGQERSAVVVVGQFIYVMANRAYWLDHAPLAAPSLSGQWVRVPRGLPGMGFWSALTQPRLLGHCVAESHVGKVALAGSASVNGSRAVVVANRGGLPGSTPGRMYVARSGAPLPLRTLQTGPRKAGGTPDPECGETADSFASGSAIVASEENFSAYNKPVTITAPRHTLTPGSSAQKPVL